MDTASVDLLQARAILYAGISCVYSPPNEEKFNTLENNEFRAQVLDAAGWYDRLTGGGTAGGTGAGTAAGTGGGNGAGMVADAAAGTGGGNVAGSVAEPVRDLFEAFADEKNVLEYEYINVFGHTLSKNTAPYGLEHLPNQEIFIKTQSMADISGFYKAFGLQPAARERVDFISVEAEFLSYLILKELIARQKKYGEEKIAVARNAQRDFLKDHFAGWTLKLAGNVAAQASVRFYRHAGNFLQNFLRGEAAYFDIPVETRR
jgi:TorA maturation chaperone TorD